MSCRVVVPPHPLRTQAADFLTTLPLRTWSEDGQENRGWGGTTTRKMPRMRRGDGGSAGPARGCGADVALGAWVRWDVLPRRCRGLPPGPHGRGDLPGSHGSAGGVSPDSGFRPTKRSNRPCAIGGRGASSSVPCRSSVPCCVQRPAEEAAAGASALVRARQARPVVRAPFSTPRGGRPGRAFLRR